MPWPACSFKVHSTSNVLFVKGNVGYVNWTVGGIKEKILAAKRANIKEIILCLENKRDIDEINSDYLSGLTFHYVKEMSEVLAIAITNEKVKNAKEL